MRAVADALVGKKLFFVDSRTSIYSCAAKEISAKGIPTTCQDGTIDGIPDLDTSAIASKFLELALASRQRDDGMLIVAHARPTSLIAIKRTLPTLQKWGIEFVPVSELVARRQRSSDSKRK
jgi:polysaccharide deacetylase 2 family uncharacterized protein YibQ